MEKENNKPIMLIIPDVHGRMFWRSAVQKYPDLPTIFLGDYLDPYTYYDGILPSEALEEFKDILHFKKQNSDRVTLLLGNHDVHYFDAKLNSSRKDWGNQEKLQKLFVKNLKHFALAKYIKVRDKEYLYSHAGIIPEWLELHFPTLDTSNIENLSSFLNDHVNDLDAFKKFVCEALMDISASRWGYAQYPSMVWADVEDHQYQKRRLPNAYQIFGHTQQELNPIIAEHYACLDCRKAFLLMEEGTLSEA